MDWFWLWVLPMVLMILLNLYQRFNLTQPFDHFWSILWIILSMMPVMSWLIFGATVVLAIGLGMSGDFPDDFLKETRLNKWLFKSIFKD